VARRDKDARFTALLHHVNVDRLREAYWAIRPQAAPGVDGVTWAAWGRELEANLAEVVAMLLEDGEPHLEAEFVGTQTVRVG